MTEILKKRDIWLLVGHGSREPEGYEAFLSLIAELKARNPSKQIDLAFIREAEPELNRVLDGYGGSAPETVWILPLLLFGAVHSKRDIPEAIREARKRHPQVDFRYGTPLGIHPGLLEILMERCRDASRGSKIPVEETALLVVGGGSSDPDANSDLYKVARLLWEQVRPGWVEASFAGVTQPGLPEGIRRCVQLGARQIIAIPYFIFSGALINRIERIASDCRDNYPGVEIRVARTLGRDPLLLELIEERFNEVMKGPVVMNCDLCKFQFPDLSSGSGRRSSDPR